MEQYKSNVEEQEKIKKEKELEKENERLEKEKIMAEVENVNKGEVFKEGELLKLMEQQEKREISVDNLLNVPVGQPGQPVGEPVGEPVEDAQPLDPVEQSGNAQ